MTQYPYRRRRQTSFRTQVCFALFLELLLISFFSSLMIARQLWREQREQNAFADLSILAAQVAVDGQAAQTLSTEAFLLPDDLTEQTQEKAILSQYAALYARNSDLAGWLSIKNAGIDLPVMRTPDEPEYYLRRGFDRENSESGTPFIGAGAGTDSDCFIIHGHNMKNNTMFGTLDYYGDMGFWRENKTISFNTLYEQRDYEVFAVLKTRVLYSNEIGLRYYRYSGELTNPQYTELTDWLTAHSEYDTGIIPAYGEQILLLSTCSYHIPNGRFVVAARRIES